MSEKKYLLTKNELLDFINEFFGIGVVDIESGWLEEHEFREHTCRLIPNEGHHGTDGLGWNCSECDYEFDEYQHQTAVFCQNCGAKVVG